MTIRSVLPCHDFLYRGTAMRAQKHLVRFGISLDQTLLDDFDHLMFS